MAAEKTSGQTVNIACGGSYSVSYLFEQVQKLLGASTPARYGERRPGDVDHSCADIARATELLDYQPVVSFEEGLRRTVEWYRSSTQLSR
jgi:nucleoside-diphosphate-sugar epimerase